MTQETATQKLESARLDPTSGKVERLVVLLHGYGSDAKDLISLVPHWEDGLPNTAFVTPNAPFKCAESPIGFQWFSIEDRTPSVMLEGVKIARPILDGFLDDELKHYGLSEDKMILGGFSQGAMMSLYTAPRRAKPCAGVISYSGRAFDVEGLLSDDISKMPILAVHGDADDVVLPDCLGESEQGFTAAGFDIETLIRPNLGHGIDDFGLVRGLSFMQEVLDN